MKKIKFKNTGNIYNDFKMIFNNNINKQISKMISNKNINNLRYYDATKIRVKYEVMIYLSHNGDYTNLNIDPYEIYKFDTLHEAITALYSVKLLVEHEKSMDKWNIEGYSLFTSVEDNGNIVVEDITDNFYWFDNLKIGGVKEELRKEIEKNNQLEEELRLYRNFLKEFNIDMETIKKHNEKLKKEAI